MPPTPNRGARSKAKPSSHHVGMRIGELATRVGLSRDALRFYEQVGILTSERRPNGYRDYPPEAVPWLAYVRTAQALGFTLAIDTRTAELAALRPELAARAGTGCPLRPAPRAG